MCGIAAIAQRPDGEASQIGKQMEKCAGCGGSLGYLIEGNEPADGTLCLTAGTRDEFRTERRDPL